MEGLPETRYVSVGEADVAYQVFGEGPVDLLYFYGLGSHVELGWETPADARFMTRLASFARVATFDRRGTGASDGVARDVIPTWEDWTDDVLGVLDAVPWESAAILAEVDAGPIAMLFAALHPERVRALVLSNTTARFMVDDDYPIGVSGEVAEGLLTMTRELWGTPDLVVAGAPSLAGDVESLRSVARCQRASATPRTAAAQYRYMFRVDVRETLSLIQAPCLILHNDANPFVPPAHGRYLAEHINGSRLVAFSSGDISGTGTGVGLGGPGDVFVDTVAEFLTGARPAVDVDRVLTTVLFTDIVASTDHLVSHGDRRWRALLDGHDAIVRAELRRFRGQEIKTTGDGFVASFDGPARAIRCAQAINEAVINLGIHVRSGLHTGECEVRGDDLAGLAVHLAARIGAIARADEVLVSSTVRDLVAGSGITFEHRGDHQLKGIPGTWPLYSIAR